MERNPYKTFNNSRWIFVQHAKIILYDCPVQKLILTQICSVINHILALCNHHSPVYFQNQIFGSNEWK